MVHRVDLDGPNKITELSVNPFMTTVVVTKLLPWRNYSVEIYAFNDIGNGPTSQLKTVRTKAEGKNFDVNTYSSDCLTGNL